MKIISSIKRTAIVAALVLGVSACSDDDDTTPDTADNNIVVTAGSDADLSVFVTALELTDLDDVLTGSGEFTVLAPTNAAFEGISLNDFEVSDLRQLLLNHVIIGKISAADLTANGSGYATTESTTGPDGAKLSLFYNTEGSVSFNGGSEVTQADIPATNGVIHKVDEIISLPSIATFATADPQFSTLATVLTDAELVGTFDLDSETEAVAGATAPFTVFAPVNAAFAELNAVPTGDDLVAVLALHVVNNANVASSSLSSVDGEVTTLQGGTVTIDAANATVQGAGNAEASTIIATDVQAVNGIIHAIDQVLLPQM